MVAGVRFVTVGRVEKESSAPHSRLVCNHLQLSFRMLICRIGPKDRRKQSNSTVRPIKTKNQKSLRQRARRAKASSYTGRPARITANVITLLVVSLISELITNAATEAMKMAGTTG
jgi:hypothetical protein